MASSNFLFFFLLTLVLLFSTNAAAARLPSSEGHVLAAARLQSDSMVPCWNSLLKLRACTGEVILFFMNGETYLGPSCCRAIHVIEHQCWPTMLLSLGFTAEEGAILRGYCDASSSPPPSPSPPTLPEPTASLHSSGQAFVSQEHLP